MSNCKGVRGQPDSHPIGLCQAKEGPGSKPQVSHYPPVHAQREPGQRLPRQEWQQAQCPLGSLCPRLSFGWGPVVTVWWLFVSAPLPRPASSTWGWEWRGENRFGGGEKQRLINFTFFLADVCVAALACTALIITSMQSGCCPCQAWFNSLLAHSPTRTAFAALSNSSWRWLFYVKEETLWLNCSLGIFRAVTMLTEFRTFHLQDMQ